MISNLVPLVAMRASKVAAIVTLNASSSGNGLACQSPACAGLRASRMLGAIRRSFSNAA